MTEQQVQIDLDGTIHPTECVANATALLKLISRFFRKLKKHVLLAPLHLRVALVSLQQEATRKFGKRVEQSMVGIQSSILFLRFFVVIILNPVQYDVKGVASQQYKQPHITKILTWVSRVVQSTASGGFNPNTSASFSNYTPVHVLATEFIVKHAAIVKEILRVLADEMDVRRLRSVLENGEHPPASSNTSSSPATDAAVSASATTSTITAASERSFQVFIDSCHGALDDDPTLLISELPSGAYGAIKSSSGGIAPNRSNNSISDSASTSEASSSSAVTIRTSLSQRQSNEKDPIGRRFTSPAQSVSDILGDQGRASSIPPNKRTGRTSQLSSTDATNTPNDAASPANTNSASDSSAAMDGMQDPPRRRLARQKTETRKTRSQSRTRSKSKQRRYIHEDGGEEGYFDDADVSANEDSLDDRNELLPLSMSASLLLATDTPFKRKHESLPDFAVSGVSGDMDRPMSSIKGLRGLSGSSDSVRRSLQLDSSIISSLQENSNTSDIPASPPTVKVDGGEPPAEKAERGEKEKDKDKERGKGRGGLYLRSASKSKRITLSPAPSANNISAGNSAPLSPTSLTPTLPTGPTSDEACNGTGQSSTPTSSAST
jgi:hypothetical protein